MAVLYIGPPEVSHSAAAEVLVLEDIGLYRLFTGIEGRVFSGPQYKYSQPSPPGVLGSSGHFADGDVSYAASYKEPGENWPFVDVQVTKHAGSDSDRWLLHEIEGSFRENPVQDSIRGMLREIGGNRVITYRLGTHYRWISNNVVVDISYTDLQKTKPEPVEVIQAYLRKFPSTIPASLVFDKAHDIQWIKDEMERRLWLCDKWYMQSQVGKVEQREMLQELVRHMNVFLDYREKYFRELIFFTMKAAEEKDKLEHLLTQNNGTAIRNKLAEYKEWWSEHKGRAISVK